MLGQSNLGLPTLIAMVRIHLHTCESDTCTDSPPKCGATDIIKLNNDIGNVNGEDND